MAEVIPVIPQPEPDSFDKRVRQPGVKWLAKNNLNRGHPLPSGVSPKPYWRECLDDLYECYQGVCAYVCIHFERVTGGGTVDHFIPKSSLAGLTYEWSNYRLACQTMNSRKRDYIDVLDPFEVREGMFRLELVSGRIFSNPGLSATDKEAVEETIRRLKLDSPACREIRARHFFEYSSGDYTADFLKKRSPFVWSEARRQGLL